MSSLVLLLAACTETPGTCDPAGTGSLTLTLDVGAPGSALRQKPVAVVYGPDGAEVGRYDATTTLDDLPGGTYTVEAWRGEGDGAGLVAAAVTGVADAPVSEVCVGGADAELTLTWGALPSGGHLWVTSGESIAAFSTAQLDAGGTVDADLRLDETLVNDFRGIAFDRTGVLWAATGTTYGTRLKWWTPGRLTGVGDAPSTGELASSGFDVDGAGWSADLHDLAFTPDGTLWVAFSADTRHGVLGFDRATLDAAVAGGESVEVDPDYVRLVDPVVGEVDLEVGPSGELWLSDFYGDAIYRVDAPTDGASTADASFQVYADGASEPMRAPENLAFTDDGDAIGFFWTGGQIAVLDGAALQADGAHDLTASPGGTDVTDLVSGLVVDGTGRALAGNYTGEAEGQLLSWTPGDAAMASALRSADIPDPRDLVLDPRPR